MTTPMDKLTQDFRYICITDQNYRSVRDSKSICFVSILVIFVQDTTPLESSGTVVESEGGDRKIA